MKMNYWNVKDAESLNAEVAVLPKGVLKDVFDEKGNRIENWKRIEVAGQVVDIPSDKYVLKQHEEVFRPIVEGLTVAGVKDFKYCLWNTLTYANLSIFVGTVNDGKEGIKYGFNIKNSLDRGSAINYGMSATKVENDLVVVQKDHVLIWGVRKVCDNGMIVKVPLKTCKYLDTEVVSKVSSLLSKTYTIRHKGRFVDSKIAEMQYVTEAYLLLRKPMELMIADAANIRINLEKANKLIELYVGKRKKDRILELFNSEADSTLWGLYNAVTSFASHEEKLSTTVREKVLGQAADMMERELLAVAPSM